MTTAAPSATRPEETSLQKLHRLSTDERNVHLKEGWKYIGHSEVTNGLKTVFFTSGVKPEDAMRHIKGVLSKQQAVEQTTE